MNYYNEFDPKAAAWLRELIKSGHIAQGEVDERSIEDVAPDDLRGFTQCHFFAGIGGWSYALRLAGWPDDEPVWTGSCPCQPFSSAGKRKGTADDRHLWPAWHWLIKQSKPNAVFGEQVASPDGIAWLDIVSTDMEGEGYTFAPVVFPACGVGAPEIRQRIWFVAYPTGEGCPPRLRREVHAPGPVERPERRGHAVGLEYAEGDGRIERRAQSIGWSSIGGRSPVRMGDANVEGMWWDARAIPGAKTEGGHIRVVNGHIADELKSTGATGGAWSDVEWLYCRDSKLRPAQPGTFPLANGVSGRVAKLRGIGNAIIPPAAAEVISAFMDLQESGRNDDK